MELTAGESGPFGIPSGHNKPLKFPVIHDLHPNCLVCSSGEADKGESSGGQTFPIENCETLELNLNVMFFLKKVLELPGGLLKELLTKCGSPWRWIGLCDECQGFVKEALALEVEVARLTRKFRKIQLEIKRKIKESQGKVSVSVDRLSYKIQFASEATRRFVSGHKYTRKKNPFLRGDKLAETIATSQNAEDDIKPDVKEEEDLDDDGDEEQMCTEDFQGISSSSEDEAEILMKPADPVRICVVTEADPLAASAAVRVVCASSTTVKSDMNLSRPAGGAYGPSILQGKSVRQRTCPTNHERSKLNSPKNHNNLEDEPSPTPSVLAVFQPITKSNSEKSFTCQMCPGLGPMDFDQLINHINFHKRRPNKCAQCSVYLGQHHSIEGHWKVVHADKQDVFPKFTEVSLEFGNLWKCPVCKEGFSTDLERTKHETKRAFKPCFTCGECSKSFDVLEEWRLHRALEHAEIAATSCWYCNERFVSKTREGVDYLDIHRLVVHLDEVHGVSYKQDKSCEYCGERFDHRLRRHVISHLTSIHGLPKKSALACDFCEKSFGDHDHQICHIKHKHHQRTHVCQICGYGVNEELRLKQHLFLQHSIRPEDEHEVLKCPKEGCTYETIILKLMKRHDLHHVPLEKRERKFTCSTCGKSFVNSRQAHKHEEIHKNANTKPYQCEICGNSFAVKNYLYIHKRLSHLNRKFPSTNKPKSRKNVSRESTTVAVNNDAGGAVQNTSAVGVNISNAAAKPFLNE